MSVSAVRVAAPALAGLGLWLGAVWAWPDATLLLTFDDSFYYFEIADNLAAGHGATFDRIEPTNGFHPLWLAICAIPFALGLEGLTAVRALLSAQILMWGASVLLLVDTATRLVGSWPRDPERAPLHWLTRTLSALVFVVAINPFVVRTFANGMESAVYALCFGAVLAVVTRTPHPLDLGVAGRVGLGALLGLAVLARTDATLMVAALGLWCMLDLPRRKGQGVAALAQILALPIAVTVAFMISNQVLIGTPLQVSGELKRVPLTVLRGLWVLVACTVPAAAVWAVTSRGGTRFPRTAILLRRSGFFVVFLGAIVAYYTGLQTFARLWYFGPIVYYTLLLAVVATTDLLQIGLDDAPDKTPGRALGPVVALVVGPLVIGFFVQTERFTSPTFIASRVANMDAGLWMSRNLDPDAVVASWDAGVLAFFTEPRVVNLDGVVNSPGYAAAMREGTTAQYLAGHGIRYVANHDDVAGGEESMADDATRILGRSRVDGWELLRTWHFAFKGSTNTTAVSAEHDMAVFLFDLEPPAAAAVPARTRQVALTLDDYPYQTGADGPTQTDTATHALVSAAIRRTLATHQMTAAVFVNCAWADADGVRRWAEAGHPIGNHTAHHKHLDRTGLEGWAADTIDCHGRLQDLLGRPPAWFRYPYLNRGSTVAIRDGATQAVLDLGERVAPVSVPTSEWLLAQHYDDAREDEDKRRMQAIGDEYVTHMVASLAQAERLTDERVGRTVPHITLAHLNHLTADHLDRVLEALWAEGWTPISLEAAMADPVYTMPDEYVGGAAVPWPARVAEGDPETALWFSQEQERLERWLTTLRPPPPAEEPGAAPTDP